MKHISIIFLFILFSTLDLYSQNSKQLIDSISKVKGGIVNSGGTKEFQITELTEEEKKLFGYSIFHDNKISFTPNLNMATPIDYVIGPGDILDLQVYGIAQKSYSLVVNKDGKVYIENIGLVTLSGLNIDAAKKILKEKLALRYIGMNSIKPNTFLDVSLADIRSIKINMIGEIKKPGTYLVPSYSNIFNAIYAAGGPTLKGTFRNIEIYRNGKIINEIDLYDFLVNGLTNKHLRLEDNDVILVRPAKIKVEIIGQVRNPGIFELKPNETLNDALDYAAGFSDKAYKKLVHINRSTSEGFKIIDLTFSDFIGFKLNDGDIIYVEKIENRFKNRVQIMGAINRPGSYELRDSMNVLDLVKMAGGLLGSALTEKALILRTTSNLEQQVISINLGNAPEATKAFLFKEDVVQISSQNDLHEQFYVQINGEVNRPGVFAYADSLGIEDLILQSGGFKYSASRSYIEVVRRVFNNVTKVAEIITLSVDSLFFVKNKKSTFQLMPFDNVFVRKLPGYQEQKFVSIVGEVNFSGIYAIDNKDMRISDLLKRSGGITEYAYTNGATLLRKLKKDRVTTFEKENQILLNLVNKIESDPILKNSESNQAYVKRLLDQVQSNRYFDNKYTEKAKNENLRDTLISENLNDQYNFDQKNKVKYEDAKEKDQLLVPIDLESIIKNPGGSEDLLLKDGDEITVPEKIETISILGGVLMPTILKYENGVSFMQYINKAGGFNPKAIPHYAYLKKANGKIERVKKWLFIKKYPTVEAGSEIIVPTTIFDQSEKSKVNLNQTIQLITGFVTSSLTLFFLLKNL